MKYKKLTGIILKKNNYREADQILTVWTRQAGKIRVMGKSLRLPKSKLAANLTELTLIEFEVAGRKNLPTVISAECINHFKNLRQDLMKMASAFYSAELMLKMTADEHPNEQAFNLMTDFLTHLNQVDSVQQYSLIDAFALDLARLLGFGTPQKARSHIDVRNFIENLIERSIKTETLLKQIV